MQGLLVGEAENDLEFVIAGRRSKHTGAEITGKIGGQLFAFAQPGDQVLVASIGNAARNHQRDGRGRHCVSP
ncbi:hypothetical protein D3C77_765100 [compost metagenome]